MLDMVSKSDIAKAYLHSEYYDLEDQVGLKGKFLPPSFYEEEFETLGLTENDYYSQLKWDGDNPYTYSPFHYLMVMLNNEDWFHKGSPLDHFYDRYCDDLEADFNKGNMHGIGLKLDIFDIVPVYNADKRSIDTLIKLDPKSLNVVLRKLGRPEVSEEDAVEARVNLEMMEASDTGDRTLNDILSGIWCSGKQYCVDAGNGNVIVYTIFHGASIAGAHDDDGYDYAIDRTDLSDFECKKVLVYNNFSTEYALHLDQETINELAESTKHRIAHKRRLNAMIAEKVKKDEEKNA